jgi:O-antigen ligase
MSSARAERAGFWMLAASVGALQFSIALAQILLTAVLIIWLVVVVQDRDGFRAPRLFWPLLAYAAVTLLSTAFSIDPTASLIDDRQLLLFLMVPAVYRLARGPRARQVLTVVLVTSAASAAIGVVQFAALHYDTLQMRAHGTVGHYMTYAGLLMLGVGVAVAMLLFGHRTSDSARGSREDSESSSAAARACGGGAPHALKDVGSLRLLSAFLLPLLLAGLAASFSRNAWVGAAAAAGVLLLLKDRRLVWLLPLALTLGLALAPARITRRAESIFSTQNATNRDRVAMLQSGLHIIRDHPWLGVGPNMVERVYPQYREPYAVQRDRPHLHNVPVQIAAERGLPALAIWIWFVGVAVLELWRKFRRDPNRLAAAAGLATLVGMVTAGLFEHNFGNSEFLMLFLTLITLPCAQWPSHRAVDEPRAASELPS